MAETATERAKKIWNIGGYDAGREVPARPEPEPYREQPPARGRDLWKTHAYVDYDGQSACGSAWPSVPAESPLHVSCGRCKRMPEWDWSSREEYQRRRRQEIGRGPDLHLEYRLRMHCERLRVPRPEGEKAER